MRMNVNVVLCLCCDALSLTFEGNEFVPRTGGAANLIAENSTTEQRTNILDTLPVGIRFCTGLYAMRVEDSMT